MKKEFSCETVRNGKAEVPCDVTCNQKKLDEEKLQKEENNKRELEERLKNKKELEKYEKLFHGKKKNKEKRIQEDVVEKTLLEQYWVLFSILFVAVALSFYLIYL